MSKESLSQEKITSEIKTLLEDFNGRLNDMRKDLNKMLDQGTKVVEDRPLMAVGISFGLGLLIGIVLDRSSRKD